ASPLAAQAPGNGLLGARPIVAVVTVAVDSLLQGLHDRARAGQAGFGAMPARIPQPGADERLRALRVNALRRDHDDAARDLSLHGEGGAELGIDADGCTAIDAQRASDTGDQE